MGGMSRSDRHAPLAGARDGTGGCRRGRGQARGGGGGEDGRGGAASRRDRDRALGGADAEDPQVMLSAADYERVIGERDALGVAGNDGGLGNGRVADGLDEHRHHAARLDAEDRVAERAERRLRRVGARVVSTGLVSHLTRERGAAEDARR